MTGAAGAAGTVDEESSILEAARRARYLFTGAKDMVAVRRWLRMAGALDAGIRLQAPVPWWEEVFQDR